MVCVFSLSLLGSPSSDGAVVFLVPSNSGEVKMITQTFQENF